MLPVVLKLAEDPVANVRFNVARTLTRLGTSIEQGLVGRGGVWKGNEMDGMRHTCTCT